ncbi:hypothetical protein PI124_g14030 [Phytophthora idaei]|nr:hypothetical protein PI124_g14030 [Phytophthora idaei]
MSVHFDRRARCGTQCGATHFWVSGQVTSTLDQRCRQIDGTRLAVDFQEARHQATPEAQQPQCPKWLGCLGSTKSSSSDEVGCTNVTAKPPHSRNYTTPCYLQR